MTIRRPAGFAPGGAESPGLSWSSETKSVEQVQLSQVDVLAGASAGGRAEATDDLAD